MDFNESNPYLANVNVRHAIAYGTNRAQMVARIVTPMAPSIKPLNNRLWMATQPAYQDTSAGYGDLTRPRRRPRSGGRDDHGLGRVLPPEQRPAEGPGPELQRSRPPAV